MFTAWDILIMHSGFCRDCCASLVATKICKCQYVHLHVSWVQSDLITYDYLTILCPRTTQKPNDVVESTSKHCAGQRTGSRVDLQMDLVNVEEPPIECLLNYF